MARKQIDLTGQKIGMLTVISRDFEEEAKRKSKTKLWKCVCSCENHTEVTMSQTTLLTESSLIRSCGCCRQPNPNYTFKKMTFEESQEWNELYQYVKRNILGYSDTQCLSNKMVLRLKGLAKGKLYANNKSVDNSNYSYKVILTTFKYCSPDIQRALSRKEFRDETHKFNYICAIIENNINTVLERMQVAKKMEERALNDDMSVATHKGAEYQRKTRKAPRGTDDLW